MQQKPDELEFLCVWAKVEKAPDPEMLPAHKLQASNQIRGIEIIRAIKAWARMTGRKDEDIFALSGKTVPIWPWSSSQEADERLSAIVAESLV